MRKLLFLCSLLFVFIFSTAGHSAIVNKTLFKNIFDCGSNNTLSERQTFSGHEGQATIMILNGGLKDVIGENILSTVVTINGEVVCDSSDFDYNTSMIVRSVRLRAGQNNIETTLKGSPGSKLGILIIEDQHGSEADSKVD